MVIPQVDLFIRKLRHIAESEFQRIGPPFLFGDLRMLSGILVFTDSMRSEHPLDIIDAQPPHKVVFLLVNMCLWVPRCSMCFTLVDLILFMEQYLESDSISQLVFKVVHKI